VDSGCLRIAMISTPWYELPPAGYGGIEAMAAVLVDALVEAGHEVTVIGVGRSGTAGDFITTNGLPELAQMGQIGPEVLHAARTATLLSHLDVDVVHDHSNAGPLQAGLRAVPTVVTAHGAMTEESGQYYRALDGTVHLVAISAAQRVQAPRLDWAGLVHNAVRTDDYPYAARKQDYVLFLGRLAEVKGAHLAIEAARAAGCPIVLAGPCVKPADREYFEREVRPRLGPDARWIGEAGFAAKVALLAGARCLLFPITWEEPFGMVLIEAMACGTPVVALRRGSVPEIVVDGVTGFVRDRPDQLGAAIRAVGRLDPLACRRWVRRRFDTARMAAEYEAIYRQVAKTRGRSLQSLPTGEPRRLTALPAGALVELLNPSG
jgi:glycosyltransferase involved in cell wall biosynthesis